MLKRNVTHLAVTVSGLGGGGGVRAAVAELASSLNKGVVVG